MKWLIPATLAIGCSSCDDTPNGVVSLHGSVGLALQTELPATLVVGVIRTPAPVPTRCGDLEYATSVEVQGLGEFPVPFATDSVPPGDHQLTALLVPSEPDGFALDGWIDVVVSEYGNVTLAFDGRDLDSISITLTGGRAYACP